MSTTFTLLNNQITIVNEVYSVSGENWSIIGEISGTPTTQYKIERVDNNTITIFGIENGQLMSQLHRDFLYGENTTDGVTITAACTSQRSSSIYIANNVPYVPSPAGGSTFPIVTTDPSSPANGDSWLLEESTVGQAIGTLGVTSTGIYNLKVKTVSGIKQVKLI